MNTREYMDFSSDEQETERRGDSNSAKFKTQASRKSFKRRGKSPQQFNGMHRRRSKSIRW